VLGGIGEIRRVVRALVDNDVRFTVSTDGPEMLRTYLRDELNLLMRHDILSMDEVLAAIELGSQASFLDRAPTIETSVGRRADPGSTNAAIPIEMGI
jgi:hypothetical protein